MAKAGWWVRFVAALIDGFITAVLFVPGAIMMVAGPTEVTSCSVDTQGDVRFDGPNNALCEGPTGGTVAMAGLLWLVATILAVIYYAVLEGKRGQTWGKMALRIRVVDAQTGQHIGAGRGVGRYFARILSGVPCYLGYLWPLWDDHRQSFHDKIVGTVVVTQ